MRWRRSFFLGFGIAVIAVAGALWALPEVVRHVAIARIEAITHRPVRIDRVELNPFTGRLAIRGLHLAERDSHAPFADFDRLDVRVRLLPLLGGHLWVRDAVLHDPTIHVVRSEQGFNFSDLLESSGAGGRRPMNVTIDHFGLINGTVTLEDRALPEPRTWVSEKINIEAHNLSTRRDDGTAVASSVTAGAPVSLEMQNMRLYPIHLQAAIDVKDLDLALARVYMPPDGPVVLDRGRVSSSLHVALDATNGARADLTGDFRDIVLSRPGYAEPVTVIPALTSRLTDFAYQQGRLVLGRFEVAGNARVRDPTAPRNARNARYDIKAIRASIADVTWPITTPGRLDVQTAVPGGGTLNLSGTLQPPPTPSQIRLKLANVDLASWNRFVPIAARVTGLAEADLRINEPLAVGMPTHASGTVAVNRLVVTVSRDDTGAREELLGARRVEASGLELQWPSRLRVGRVLVSGARGIVERDKAGAFRIRELVSAPSGAANTAAAPSAAASSRAVNAGSSSPLNVEVGEFLVRDTALTWRDDAVNPPARLGVSNIQAKVTGAGWPMHGPLHVQLALSPPGGGRLQITGKVGLDPMTADLRMTAKDAELAPYRPYVPMSAQLNGQAAFDLGVVLPPSYERRATVRGSASLSRLDVRDGERTVMKVDRAVAAGVDVDWPQRATVRQLNLDRPWILIERDDKGGLPLRALLSPPRASERQPDVKAAVQRTNTVPAPNETAAADQASGNLPIAIGNIVIADGSARVVDHAISPQFAVDLARLTARMDGLSTSAGGRRAHLDLTGRVGAGSLLTLKGTVGPLGGPLRVELDGELRGFAIPRTNPYLVHEVSWEARDGWLTTALHCRIDGDTLEARTDILLNRLEVMKAGSRDEAQVRIGLPLGMIVALMKDPRGNIHISLPVSGRLNDPKFDFSEAIWSTVRNVAVKAITLPVSWIGRVHMSADSRIERIEIDPIVFEPGTAALTPDGQEQISRLVAFLQEMPEVRMALTPVVSARDLAALKGRAVDADIERLVRDSRTSPDEAAARLFKQRFPQRPIPDGHDAIRAALLESESASAPPDLAAQRVEVVRQAVKKAGVDPGRLPEGKRVTADSREDVAGQVSLDLIQPEVGRQPERPGFLRRVLGAVESKVEPAR